MHCHHPDGGVLAQQASGRVSEWVIGNPPPVIGNPRRICIPPGSGIGLPCAAVPKYIAVAGNMGSGKTSLVEFLCNRYALKPFYEPHAENPYLEDFYDDMSRWAFASQVSFLTKKISLHQQLEATGRTEAVVLDRTIYEDAEIFATNLRRMGHLKGRDWETYWDLYETVRRSLRPPDIMIYLRCPVRSLRRRIKQRGRAMEQEVPASYLRKLNLLYEQWFDRYEAGPVEVIDTGKLDYLTDMIDRLDVLKAVEAHL